MTRHAKNCTAGPVYTYHEKQRDTKAGGYGTQHERLGKDSVKDFDCCCLTLQPCRNPVVTPDGYIYDKEAILQYIVHQKVEYSRKLKAFEKQKQKEGKERADLVEAEKVAKAAAFVASEKSIVSKSSYVTSSADGAGPSTSNGISNLVGDKAKQLPSFWVPSLTPSSKEAKMEKPKNVVHCPMSGKPLKAKDLIAIKFCLINDPDDKKSLIAKKDRFKCAVTHDVLGNHTPSAVLRTSSNVVTMECVEKLIRKDMVDPTNGKKLTERDIIPIYRGGTGYASTNEKLNAKVKKPVLMA